VAQTSSLTSACKDTTTNTIPLHLVHHITIQHTHVVTASPSRFPRAASMPPPCNHHRNHATFTTISLPPCGHSRATSASVDLGVEMTESLAPRQIRAFGHHPTNDLRACVSLVAQVASNLTNGAGTQFGQPSSRSSHGQPREA